MESKQELIGFNESLADKVKEQYGLSNTTVNMWRSRGNIPAAYLTTAVPITLTVKGGAAEVRTLHCWRLRLNLTLKELAEKAQASIVSVNNWEAGKKPVSKIYYNSLVSVLQTTYNQQNVSEI